MLSKREMSAETKECHMLQKSTKMAADILTKYTDIIQKCDKNDSTLLSDAVQTRDMDQIVRLLKLNNLLKAYFTAFVHFEAHVQILQKRKRNVAPSANEKACLEEGERMREIAKRVDVNAADNMGNTPLHQSINTRSADITKLLLENGCDLTLRNRSNNSPIHLAVYNGDMESLAIMCEHSKKTHGHIPQVVQKSPVNQRILHSNDTCLHLAVERSSSEMVSMLVDAGALVNATNDQSQTPLLVACKNNHVEVARKLLQVGADLNIPGWFGKTRKTPLGIAAKYNYRDLFELLIDSGANINSGDFSGPCPLYIAIINDAKSVIDYILTGSHNKVLDVHKTNGIGDTLLHAIVSHKGEDGPDLVGCLCKLGCDVNRANKLRHYPLHDAIGLRDYAMTQSLVELGADLELHGRWGENALHISASLGLIDIGVLLITSGSDINARTDQGRSALFNALDFGHFDFAEMLLDFGFDLTNEIYFYPGYFGVPDRLCPSFLKNDSSIFRKYQERALSPETLFYKCVKSVRMYFIHIRHPLYQMNCLPLPNALKAVLYDRKWV